MTEDPTAVFNAVSRPVKYAYFLFSQVDIVFSSTQYVY